MVQDQLRSVRALYRRDGTWRWFRQFGPYGDEVDLKANGTVVGNKYGWTGRERDPETGFYFLRNRYYDAKQRRFTQEDPIGFEGGGNLYAYVKGAPLEKRDPSGLVPGDGYVGDRSPIPHPLCYDCMLGGGWDGWFGVSGTLLGKRVTYVTEIGPDGTRHYVLTGHVVSRGVVITIPPAGANVGQMGGSNTAASGTDFRNVASRTERIYGIINQLKDLPNYPEGIWVNIPMLAVSIGRLGLDGKFFCQGGGESFCASRTYEMPRGIFDTWYAPMQPAFARVYVTPLVLNPDRPAVTAFFYGIIIYPYYNYTGPGID